MSSTDSLPELDALRSQVADLSRQLAERDRSAHHQRGQSDLLRAIVEGTAAETGDAFFSALVRHLTSVLHIKYAFIGEVQGDHIKKIRTLAVSTGGAIVDNFEYALADTPCATALTQGFACFARGLQSMFPQFQRVADLGAESYCAVPLRTKGEAIMGLLVVMDTKPWQQGDDLRSLLEVFAPRIAAEFERRRAEQERAQALADLHNVIETIPDIVFALDPQGNVVKWNRRLGDVTGYSHAELWNKPALAFVPPEEQGRTAAAIQRVFVEGYAELEGHLLTKARRLIPYHWTGALLKNTHGEPIGITGVGRDVSEEKRAEEELTKQRRHLVDAQALAHLGSWGWDIDTGELQWSDELFRIFGHEPGSIHVTYDTFLAALLPDDHDRVLARINAALAGKMSYDIEYRIVRPNSEVRSIHARGDVYRDSTGHPLSMAGTVLDITERKRIEDALRASEERWHLAVRGSNDGIWDRNIQTGEVFFSSRWKAMRGFEDHEIRNDVDEWRSRIHPDDLDRVLQSVDAYLAKQAQEFCEEYRVQRKDGSCLWILDRGVALWADDGTPLRMVGSETDITARKGAEEALVRSRDLLNSFVEHTPAGVAMLDKSLRYVAVSRRWMEDYRLGDQPVIGRHHYDVFPEIKEMKGWQKIHQRCLSGTVERHEEDHFTRADGSEDWLRWEVRPWHDITGEIGGIIMFTEVITERKQADAALRASEERYRSLYDDTPTMYFTLATNGTVLSVNRFGAEQLGYQEEELIGHSVLGFIHEEDKEAVAASLSECLATPEITRHWDFRKMRTDGTVIWVQETARVSQSSTGETVVLVTCEDITQRKRAEHESHERIRQAAAMQTALLELAHLDDISLTFSTILPHITRIVADVLAVERVSLWLLSRDQTELVCQDLYLRSQATHSAGSRLAASSYPRYLAVLKESLVIGASNARVDQRTSEFADDYFLSLGITSVLDVPIRRQGKVIGVLWCEHVGMPREWVPEVQDFGASVGQSIARMIEASERRRAEISLRQSEERYRSLVDNAPIGIFVVEAGRFVYANREMQRILNATRAEQLLGMPILDRIAQEFHSVVKDRIHQLMEKGQPVPSLDSQFVRLDGSRIDVAVTAIPTSFDGTDVIQVLVLDIAERKRGEQEQARLIEDLTRSQQHFQAFFNWTPSAVGISTVAEGRFINVNEGFSRLTGYMREEVIGRTTLELGLWADVSERESVLREILEQGYLHNREGLLRTKFGEIRSLMVSVESIQLGSTPCLIYLCHDITERKLVEERLRRTQFSMDQAVDAIYWVDAQAKILFANEAASLMVGYSRDELLGMTVKDLNPDFAASRWPGFWEEVRQNRSMSFETVHRAKDGRLVPIDIRVSFLAHEGHEFHCAFVRDITERKQVEEALRKKDLELDHYFTSALDLLCIADVTGRFKRLNKAWELTLGYSLEELEGAKFLDYVHPDDMEVTLHALGGLAEQKEVPTFVNRYRRKDGSYRWIEWKSIPAGGLIYASARDITERKRMEDALRMRERELQTALQERERISQDLHDGILQSLFAVGLTLEVAKSLMPPKTLKASGVSLNKAIDQLNRVMREIRNFIAGLNSESLEGKNLPAALKHLLESLTENQPTRVRFAVEDRAAKALSAEQSLHLLRVIQEAVSNCIRHGHAQEARVSLKLLKQGVRLRIRDDGRGFSQDTVKAGGYGLRNMAARAQRLGGRFTVISRVKEGTNIVLDLPKEVSDVSL